MKFLIEGEKYLISDLENIFKDSKFYNQSDIYGTITSVGYYYSFDNKELVYLLPKVFMKDGKTTVFDISKDELYKYKVESFKHKEEFKWVRQLSIYFYNSLIEYKKRNEDSILLESSEIYELNTNVGNNEYSYLDLLLSFVNFYKKNKNTILFKTIEYQSNQAKKPKWEKTIRKSLPILTSSKQPVYINIRNKKNIVNTEEELLTYFFSILNNFDKEHQLNLQIHPTYKIIKGSAFERLQKTGLTKLRKIKYRYFSDILKRIYHLCEIYFYQQDISSQKNKKEEFISINNYNLVFEDMVDKLFSENIEEIKVNDISINDLKKNNDGKIIDHIYDYQSLIDTSNIFYIGDSKYYKSTTKIEKIPLYKQFTYAKNIIQFNIDLLNNGDSYKDIRYRDKITEGYNLTPNFFVFGYIKNVNDFDNSNLKLRGDTLKSYHFEERLFDRDTLFVQQYELNFLFVLKSYTALNKFKIKDFRDSTKKLFRNKFIDYFNSDKFEYLLFEKSIISQDAETILDENFKLLNGNAFYTNDDRLIIAVFKNNAKNEYLIDDIEKLNKFIESNHFVRVYLGKSE